MCVGPGAHGQLARGHFGPYGASVQPIMEDNLSEARRKDEAGGRYEVDLGQRLCLFLFPLDFSLL